MHPEITSVPVITIDIDWAPDYMIDYVSLLLVEKNIRATWFATHYSPAVDRLVHQNHIFEVGIHPNFLPTSTQGKNEDEIMAYFNAAFPKAQSMRLHCLFQYNTLLNKIVDESQIRIDSSIFLPHAPNLQPVAVQTGKKKFWRLPYFWGDQYYLSFHRGTCKLEKIPRLLTPGLKIFNFHPIHIYINTDTVERYNAAKMHSENASGIEQHRNVSKPGIGDLFLECIDYVGKAATSAQTLTELILPG